MAKIRVRVNVDRKGKVTVTQRPRVKTLKLNEDTVVFTSNRSDTAIKFNGSPLAELNGRRILELPARKIFKVVRMGKTGKIHFDCGYLDGKTFRKWGEKGDNIPPC